MPLSDTCSLGQVRSRSRDRPLSARQPHGRRSETPPHRQSRIDGAFL